MKLRLKQTQSDSELNSAHVRTYPYLARLKIAAQDRDVTGKTKVGPVDYIVMFTSPDEGFVVHFDHLPLFYYKQKQFSILVKGSFSERVFEPCPQGTVVEIEASLVSQRASGTYRNDRYKTLHYVE